MPTEPPISSRAMAIANGLIRTSRAADHRVVHGYVQLRAKRGAGYYWVALDGSRLLRGDELDRAEEIQDNFVAAMIRAGRGK